MDDPEQANAEEVTAINVAFLNAGAQAALTPALINRFQLYNLGQPGGVHVLVVGGAALSEVRPLNEDHQNLAVGKQAVVSIAGAFAMERQLAADMAIFLIKEFNIDEATLVERRKNYPGQFPEQSNG